jgi:hypothetical protein
MRTPTKSIPGGNGEPTQTGFFHPDGSDHSPENQDSCEEGKNNSGRHDPEHLGRISENKGEKIKLLFRVLFQRKGDLGFRPDDRQRIQGPGAGV